jgi:hypothetical protein
MTWLRKLGLLWKHDGEALVNSDPRWRKLNDNGIKCASCGQLHKGVFDLGRNRPDNWRGIPDDKMDIDNVLLEDFCVVDGEDFFIRGVFEIPIIGLDGERFGYGVWSSLSKANFELYENTFRSGKQAELGPWFGWFSNSLKGYPETMHLKCNVHPRNENQRPTIELEPTDHPLAIEQREGITINRLFEIYEINGHRF